MSMNLDSLVPEQGDRDELIQLLNLIAIQWHQNEEAFEHRHFADWPQWCEDQGFRFDVLQAFALKLEATLIDSAGTSTISQQIRSLGSNATIPQLLDSLSEHSPHLLKAFEEVLRNSEEAERTLDAMAGGTAGKWMKNHPWVDAAAVGGATAIGIGIGRIAAYHQNIQRREREVAARHENQVSADVDARTQTIEEDIANERPRRDSGSISGSEISRSMSALNKYNDKLQEELNDDANGISKRLFSLAGQSSYAEKLELEAKSEAESYSDKLTQQARSELHGILSEEEENLEDTIIHGLQISLDKEIERLEGEMIRQAKDALSPEIKQIEEEINVIDDI